MTTETLETIETYAGHIARRSRIDCADDLRQEGFTAYLESGSIQTANRAMERLAWRERFRRSRTVQTDQHQPEVSILPVDPMEASEEADRICQQLSGMPADDQLIVAYLLIFGHGINSREIGLRLGIADTCVRKRLQRIREQFAR